ncbi:protein translocase subunit SecF [Candidatus Margulisiibacteriota bacterium]
MKLDVIGKEKIFWPISAVLVVVSLFLIFTQGLNLGIDFTGGVVVHLRFNEVQDISALRKSINDFGVTKEIVQSIGKEGKEWVIKIPPITEEKRNGMVKLLLDNGTKGVLLESNLIGPTVGQELQKQAILIILLVVVLLLIYITFRFEFFMAVSAIVALLHDPLIVLGVAALLKWEVNIAFLAAVLTLMGYSLNDTIVVFDRVRDTLKGVYMADISKEINISINAVLRRTINTSVTTIIVVFIMMLFGGKVLHEFSRVLFIGAIVGTYSSLFVATPVFGLLHKVFAKD